MDFMEKVTDISKKVGQAVEKTYEVVKDKSGKMIEENKLRMKVNENEKDINVIFQEMGKSVYNSYKTGESVDKVFAIECDKIDGINKEISTMEITIMHLKKLKKCDSCNQIIKIEDKFCPYCGEGQKAIKTKIVKVEGVPAEEKAGKNICKSCGESVAQDTKFCPKCGYEF